MNSSRKDPDFTHWFLFAGDCGVYRLINTASKEYQT